MAIVKMRKLKLVALSYDKDLLLNALQKTGAVQITPCKERENTVVPTVETEDLKTRYATAETALSSLCVAVETFEKENGVRSDATKNGFEVSYAEFMGTGKKEDEAQKIIEEINALTDRKNALKTELSKTQKQKEQAEIYSRLYLPFSAFSATAHTRGRLGIFPAQYKENLKTALLDNELCSFELLRECDGNALAFVLCHKSVAEETDGVLSAFGFSDCPHKGEETGAQIYEKLQEEERDLKRAILENGQAVYAMKDKIRFLKIYCDYFAFTLEKAECADKFLETQRTFALEAYVPQEAEERVREAIAETAQAYYLDFSDPEDSEEVPTLLKNNKIVENFEGITNTYSAPNYREFDPNAVMAFFYSLFMGFIIGDAGYGLLMLLGGGYLWWKGLKRPTGLSRLAGAFAVGGIFAIVWGALFNSLFGFAVFEKTVMPNPQTDMWSLAGISVPAVLIIAMLVGIVQLFTGYICKAVQEWRRGGILDGICDGLLWAVFSVGVALAIIGFVDEAGLPILGTVGGITAGVSLFLAVVTAGRHEKFFGKFTKGFGTAYGVINYASDILSYARLYGLMLSGAVIAQIIATYSAGFIASGSVLMAVLGVLLLVVGHGFNLVMNLLGAYIHDARLQYVEFYGRFYEGEGELFTPLGSNRQYVYLQPEEKMFSNAKA